MKLEPKTRAAERLLDSLGLIGVHGTLWPILRVEAEAGRAATEDLQPDWNGVKIPLQRVLDQLQEPDRVVLEESIEIMDRRFLANV